MRDWRIFVFADPRRMGKEAYDCYLGWHQEPRNSRILWVGYSKTDSDGDFRCKGEGIEFDESEYDKAHEMLKGKGWKLLSRANALVVVLDSKRGKFIDVCDLGPNRIELMRKLQKQVDYASAPEAEDSTGNDDGNRWLTDPSLMEIGGSAVELLLSLL